MKLVKKLIAATSALAMAATMFSAVVVHAADEPIVSLRLDEVSEGVYNLALNMDTTGCELGNKMNSLQFSIGGLDADIFDMENGPLHQVYDEDAEEYVYDSIGYGKTKYESGSFSYKNNIFTYVFSDSTGKGQAMSAATDIITLNNLTLKSGVTTADVSLDIVDFICEVGAGSSSCKSYGVAAQKPSVILSDSNLTGATFPGNKPTEPVEPDKPTVSDDGTILPIKPSDIGGTGDVFVGEDGSKAVAGLGNFTSASTVNGIEWTIKYKPVGGEEVTKSKTFTPEWLAGATLETKMTIGLIVNYSPAEYESVTIVSGALN